MRRRPESAVARDGVSVDVAEEEQVRRLIGRPAPHRHPLHDGRRCGIRPDRRNPAQRLEGYLFQARFFGQLYAVHHAVHKMPEGSVILLLLGRRRFAAYVPDYCRRCGHLPGLSTPWGGISPIELAPRSIRVNVLSPGFIIGTEIKFNLEGEKAIDFVQRSIARNAASVPRRAEGPRRCGPLSGDLQLRHRPGDRGRWGVVGGLRRLFIPVFRKGHQKATQLIRHGFGIVETRRCARHQGSSPAFPLPICAVRSCALRPN